MKLKLNNITKNFDNKKILDSVDFTFEKGKIYGLLGRNGAGKTTLFNCISEELPLDSGSVSLINDEGLEKNIDSSNIGYVYSDPILPDFLTGYEFIKFYIDIHKDKIKNLLTVEEYLEFIKIEEDDRHKLIKSYSFGMKNKIQMLCYLITKPDIILLDEPLTSFDVVVALEIKNLLKEIKKDHILIFSTHILQLAVDLCDELVILKDGKLSLIDNNILKSDNFENEIMDILKEDIHV
ncbi:MULTISPECIES: ABC transporter ATP-binding protein [unclassified Clostridium]|uniref:ABC transporter ATP-binding protein n=1 Tax=unclassified Clostridium TaxID=2614128 RepID=UPI001897F999|nr:MULTISPECIES: ABC transporter ATP-binding protein [unclassified Clostridium]MBP3915779.1 ABC transporter ATP-binding protein [Clostridium sp.]MEE0931813.1 ABC transporter ATP-binding protein [Clostridium sp.]